MNERAKAILHFWFNESSMDQRFSYNAEFDQKIKEKFFLDYQKAINNKYDEWQNHAKECLALIIMLDQFSRNLFRNNSKAFVMDAKARLIANEAIDRAYIAKLSTDEILFIILPLIHSEDLSDHMHFYKLFDTYFKDHPKFYEAKKMNNLHTDIIKRFGRYPYRNKVLGRESTNDEIEYLNTTHHKFFKI
jgi:uncharacterized protein (DUF924 family)